MIPNKWNVSGLVKSSFIAFFLSASLAHADNRGVLEYNASGWDGNFSGEDGENGGQIDLTLSYADSAKSQVNIRGSVRTRSHTDNIQQTVPIANLSKIYLYANGGNGAAGQTGDRGFDGTDGQRGWDGSAGCPPQAGTNGTNGTDGGPGRDGRDGGNGGRGGTIVVHAAPGQTELLLLISSTANGGNAGAAGQGGEGGRAGHGGAGGAGGRNTCDPKGSDAPDGFPGFDGRDGQNGRDGFSGNAGRAGSAQFEVGGHSYDAPFALSIQGTLDDEIEDGVLQPGERVSITQLKITNTGDMPTPAGQEMTVLLTPNSTLTPVKMVPVVIDETLNPGETTTIKFKSGEMVLQVPYDSKLIGRRAVLASTLRINKLTVESEAYDTGYILSWPLVATAMVKNVKGLFEGPTVLTFTLKNVSKKDIGPKGIQPFALNFAWDSNNIPGAAVNLTLPDGRKYKLSSLAEIDDLTVKAGEKITLALSVVVFDSKSVKEGDGTFKFGLKLKDLSTGKQEVVQTADTYMYLQMDLFNLAFDLSANVASQNITCVFKNRAGATIPVTNISMSKAKTATKVKVKLSIKTDSKVETSPEFSVSSHLYIPYYENFQMDNFRAVTLQLLNKELSPQSLTGKNPWAFSGCK